MGLPKEVFMPIFLRNREICCRSDAWVGVTRVLYFKHVEEKLQRCLDALEEERVHRRSKRRDTSEEREATEEITKQDRRIYKKVTTQKRRNVCHVLIVLYSSRAVTDALNTAQRQVLFSTWNSMKPPQKRWTRSEDRCSFQLLLSTRRQSICKNASMWK